MTNIFITITSDNYRHEIPEGNIRDQEIKVIMNLQEALIWRYATKDFDATKKISEGDWSLLEETMRLSPSSYGLQPWKIYVVENKDVRAKLRPISWNQGQITDSSHLVVLAFKEKVDEFYVNAYLEDMAKTRGITVESLEGFKGIVNSKLLSFTDGQLSIWAQRQVYILMGFLLLAAAELGIDACPLEGIDPVQYDEILQVADGYKTVAAVALGYRSQDDKYATMPKVRFAKEKIIEYIK